MPVLQAIRSVCTEFRPAAVFGLCAPQRVFVDRDFAHGASRRLEDTRHSDHFRSDRYDDRALAGGGNAPGGGLLCGGVHSPLGLFTDDLSSELRGLSANGLCLCDLGDHGCDLRRDGQNRWHQHAVDRRGGIVRCLFRRPLFPGCDQCALGCGTDPHEYL